MTAKQKKKLIAAVILAANEAGVKMDSPYAIQNLCEDVLCVHSETIRFFYRESDGEPIDVIANAQKVLAS